MKTNCLPNLSGTSTWFTKPQSAWIENSDDLVTCFQNTLCETQSNIDESVDLLTLRVTDIMRPFLKLTKGLRNQFITQVEQDPIHVWCHRANLALMKILVKKNTGYIDQHSSVLIIQKAHLNLIEVKIEETSNVQKQNLNASIKKSRKPS